MSMSTSPSNEYAPVFKLKHRLAVMMEEANVPVAEMAKDLGLGTSTIYAYLAGDRVPKLSAVKQWATRCGRPRWWNWLLTGQAPDDNDGGPGKTATDGDPSTNWYKRPVSLTVVKAA